MTVQVAMQSSLLELEVEVMAQATPSLLLGDNALRKLYQMGWCIDEEAWLSGAVDNQAGEPRSVSEQGDMSWGTAEDLNQIQYEDMDQRVVDEAEWSMEKCCACLLSLCSTRSG